jgi:Tol biopolymer transport system component
MKSQPLQVFLTLIVVALAICACGPSREGQTVTEAVVTAVTATKTPTSTPNPTNTSSPTSTPVPISLAEACINDLASYSGLDSYALQEYIINDIFQTFPEFELFGQPAEFFSEFFSVFSPALSPNERKIAFSAGVASGEMFINYGIYILEVGSDEISRLVPDRAAVEILLLTLADKHGWTEESTNEIQEIMGIASWAINPVWSPDGQKIEFLFGFGDSLADIWVINADGSGLVSMGSGEVQYNGSWSPDSQQIIFTTQTFNKTNHIVRVNADGSELTRLTSEDAYYESVSWSPDGQKIVFVASPEKTSGIREFADIYIMNADGSGLINLTTGFENGAINPKWTPDGQQIHFNSVDYDYFVVNIDGTNLTSTDHDSPVNNPDRFKCPANP